jgi:hypothetical protein
MSVSSKALPKLSRYALVSSRLQRLELNFFEVQTSDVIETLRRRRSLSLIGWTIFMQTFDIAQPHATHSGLQDSFSPTPPCLLDQKPAKWVLFGST